MSNKKKYQKKYKQRQKKNYTSHKKSCNIVLLSTIVQRGLIAEKTSKRISTQKGIKLKSETHLLELILYFTCLLCHK